MQELVIHSTHQVRSEQDVLQGMIDRDQQLVNDRIYYLPTSLSKITKHVDSKRTLKRMVKRTLHPDHDMSIPGDTPVTLGYMGSNHPSNMMSREQLKDVCEGKFCQGLQAASRREQHLPGYQDQTMFMLTRRTVIYLMGRWNQ